MSRAANKKIQVKDSTPLSRRNSKRYVCLCIFTLLLFPFSAAGFFNGVFEGSLSGNAFNQSPWFTVTADTFFSAQIDFSNGLGIETAVSAKIGNGAFFIPMLDTSAVLNFDQISVQYSIPASGFRHTISAFTGREAVFGTDTWLRQNIGSGRIDSKLMIPNTGMYNTGVYQVYGTGLSYTLKFSEPRALDFFVHWDRKNVSGSYTDYLAFDARFAGRGDFGVIELFAGLSGTMGRTQVGANSIPAIVTPVQFRGGFTGLLGKTHSDHVYVQAAVIDLSTDTADTFSLNSNFYFLAETRFVFGMNRLIISLFNIPQSQTGRMPFTPKPIGAAVTFVFSDAGWQSFEAGCTASISTGTFQSLSVSTLSINIAPFTAFNLGPGQMTVSADIAPLNYNNGKPIVTLSAGYKLVI